jgi:hypothetical protein
MELVIYEQEEGVMYHHSAMASAGTMLHVWWLPHLRNIPASAN